MESEIITRARALRKQIEENAAQMSDETAKLFPELFPRLSDAVEAAAGDRACIGGKLYKYISDKWEEIGAEEETGKYEASEDWPLWCQPVGLSTSYTKGDQVTYNGRHYVSKIKLNMLSPEISTAWEEQE